MPRKQKPPIPAQNADTFCAASSGLACGARVAVCSWRQVLLLLLLLASSAVIAAEPDAAGDEFFEKKIRPLLATRCFECHNEEAAESGLRLDSLAHILKGGTRGPALVPGDPEASLLIRAVQHDDILQMPPKEKLPAAAIADLMAWVRRGAPWPNETPSVMPRPQAEEEAAPFSDEERGFWSFQPPQRRPLPAVVDQSWIESPVDAFILQQLEAHGLPPAPAADKRTLIRRVTFDLTGLPPTPAEIDAFVADATPQAFARLIDRLLASPRYGERWARHWLDVVRYADSNGLDENLAYANAFHYRDYVVAAFNKDKSFDQFVREQIAGDLLATAHAEDVPPPFDWDEAFEGTVATGFLSLGAKMLAEDDPVKMQMDIIDEQVDTLGQAFLGLTLGCARCHDHKFDPLRMSDYYALAGIFKSTKTMENFKVVAQWQEVPLASRAALAARQEQRVKIDQKQSAIAALVKAANDAVVADARQHVASYLRAALEHERQMQRLARVTPIGNELGLAERQDVLLVEAEEYARGNVLQDRDNYGRGIGVLVNRGETPNFTEYDVDVPLAGEYQCEIRLAAANSRPCKLFINGVLVKADAASHVTGTWYPDSQTWFVEGFYRLAPGRNVVRLEHPQFFPHIDKLLFVPLSHSGEEAGVAQDYEPKAEFVRQWWEFLQQQRVGSDSPVKDSINALQADPTQPVPAALEQVAKTAALDSQGPFAIFDTIETYYSASEKQALDALRKEKQSLEAGMPKFPEAMSVSEGQPEDIRIHFRGSHLTQGRLVPRRMPAVLASTTEPLAADRSGRQELAAWLTSPHNPLTARVIVNRIWQWHMGDGLVRSPDNFGRLGQAPTHPELLDWLTLHFVESGWSLKELHRTILLSATYQMSAEWNERAAAVDPDNRWRWRFTRRRLEVEAIRDAMLSVSGQLDLSMGGSLLPTPNRQYVTSTASVDPVVYDSPRRSIYLPVVRSALYEVFQAFDFADPSTLSGQRQTTTVAPQALFMMNSKFVSEQAQALAGQLLRDEADDGARVRRLYQQAFGRVPDPTEVDRASTFVAARTKSLVDAGLAPHDGQQRAWQSLVRAVLSANEFIFIE